jgi:trimeric autotransporter adhesin
MFSGLRSRLSLAHLVSAVALFVALGGTALATHPGGANTISTGDIIDGQVKSLDVGNGEVKGEDLAANSVGDSKIADRSVKNADLGIGASSSNTIADGGIQGIDVKNGTLTIPKLSFDPATQAELDELASSDADPPNEGSNRVHWNVLGGVPAGFADGVDDVGGSNGWSLSGNSGTDPSTDFLGTSDDQPLNLRVNDARALRLEPASDGTNPSPNLIGGSADNTVTAGVFAATIGGGGRYDPADAATANKVTDSQGTVGGGVQNQAGDADADPGNRLAATVGGGRINTASGNLATVGGGQINTASGLVATVGGGQQNSANGDRATVAGGWGNSGSGAEATVGGGNNNFAPETQATVGGGGTNFASAPHATVAGGTVNTASAFAATVGGGLGNTANGLTATVPGGSSNTANGDSATVAGGHSNNAVGGKATVGGGFNNSAGGFEATVPGGENNTAHGNLSFAAGHSAHANHNGSFVWADLSFADITSTAANQFIARASGNFFLQSDSTLDDQGGFINTSTGAFLSTGGEWTNNSDRRLKHRFAALQPGKVLRDLTKLPVRSWSYKAEPGVRHIGPVAQDFHRLFRVGADDRHIGSVDEAGVALAAIKGLNRKLHRKLRAERRRHDEQERRIADLESRLTALERGGR